MSIEIDEFYKKVGSFDLLCTSSSTTFSKLINWAQYRVNGGGGIYSHVGLCIRGDLLPENEKFSNINRNKMYLFECILDTKDECPDIFGQHIDGVQIRDLEEVISSYFNLKRKGKMQNIGWCRLKENHKEKIKTSYNIFSDRYLNLKYNFNILDQIYVPFHNYFIVKKIKQLNSYVCDNSNKVLCTGFVGEILKELEILEKTVDTNLILPESLISKNDMETYDNVKQIPALYELPLEIIYSENISPI